MEIPLGRVGEKHLCFFNGSVYHKLCGGIRQEGSIKAQKFNNGVVMVSTGL